MLKRDSPGHFSVMAFSSPVDKHRSVVFMPELVLPSNSKLSFITGGSQQAMSRVFSRDNLKNHWSKQSMRLADNYESKGEKAKSTRYAELNISINQSMEQSRVGSKVSVKEQKQPKKQFAIRNKNAKAIRPKSVAIKQGKGAAPVVLSSIKAPPLTVRKPYTVPSLVSNPMDCVPELTSRSWVSQHNCRQSWTLPIESSSLASARQRREK